MNNEEFLKNINRDLQMSKNEMKSKNENVIKELNDYKSMLNEELERENDRYSMKEKLNTKVFQDEDSNEEFESIIKYDGDYGQMIDFYELDDDGYDVIMNLASNDPSFALKFIENRRSEIPLDKYENMKNELLKKLNIE